MTSLAKVPYKTSTVIRGAAFCYYSEKIEKKAKRPKIVILKAENIKAVALRKVGIHQLAHNTNQA